MDSTVPANPLLPVQVCHQRTPSSSVAAAQCSAVSKLSLVPRLYSDGFPDCIETLQSGNETKFKSSLVPSGTPVVLGGTAGDETNLSLVPRLEEV